MTRKAFAKIKKAVLPVGGLGTRFLPATKVMPKEMLTVVDKPLIQYAVEEARAAGIEEIIIVTAGGKVLIEDHFDRAFELEATLQARGRQAELEALHRVSGVEGDIVYTRQRQPLGLGHAVWCARHLVGGAPFAVLLPDDLVQADTPCLSQMQEAYGDCGGNLVAVMEVPRAHTARYGILDPGSIRDRLVEVRGLVEKPRPEEAPSTLSIIGRYILQPEIFTILQAGKRGAGNEIQLTDAMAGLLGRQPFHGYRFEGVRHDCGDKLGFITANIAYGMERAELRQGLTDFMKVQSSKQKAEG